MAFSYSSSCFSLLATLIHPYAWDSDSRFAASNVRRAAQGLFATHVDGQMTAYEMNSISLTVTQCVRLCRRVSGFLICLAEDIASQFCNSAVFKLGVDERKIRREKLRQTGICAIGEDNFVFSRRNNEYTIPVGGLFFVPLIW